MMQQTDPAGRRQPRRRRADAAGPQEKQRRQRSRRRARRSRSARLPLRHGRAREPRRHADAGHRAAGPEAARRWTAWRSCGACAPTRHEAASGRHPDLFKEEQDLIGGYSWRQQLHPQAGGFRQVHRGDPTARALLAGPERRAPPRGESANADPAQAAHRRRLRGRRPPPRAGVRPGRLEPSGSESNRSRKCEPRSSGGSGTSSCATTTCRISALPDLAVLKEMGLDLPFLVVSGIAGEEVGEVDESGRARLPAEGAAPRLIPAVRRELEQAGQRRAKRKAEETQAQFAAIVEFSDDAIIGRTFNGAVTTWNGGAERLYGYSAEEVLGRTMSLHVPADRADEIRSYVERIRRGEIVDNFETVRIRKDGTRIEVSLTVSPIRNSSGEVIGASTIARDITQRRRDEESIQKLLSAVRQAKNAIFMTDPNGAINYINPAFEQIYGYSKREALGKTPRILKSANTTRPSTKASGQGCWLANPCERSSSTRQRTAGSSPWKVPSAPSSTRRDVESVSSPYKTTSPSASATRKCSRRGSAISALSSRTHRTSSRSSTCRARSVSRVPRPLMSSGALRKKTFGRSAFDFIHPDDMPGVREAIGRAVRSPESAQTSVYRFRHANGSWRTLEGVGKVLPAKTPRRSS